MRLAVIGCGYVGLVTGACLAAAGHEVFCTDIDETRINQLRAGKVPIYEQHLEEVLKRAAADKKITFTADAGEAIRAGEVIFICVGTPPRESGEADLSAIDHVARQVAKEARTSKLVVEKSTVPALTGIQLQKAMAAYSRGAELKFQVASNPEFLREGTAVGDFFHPDRIVVGVEDEDSAAKLREIYRPILEKKFHCPVHADKCPTSRRRRIAGDDHQQRGIDQACLQLVSGAENQLRQRHLDLCERIGADVEEVTHAMGLDPRIGTQFLKAGLGFGGFCFPKDIQAFIHLSASVGVDFEMLKAAERVNKQRIDRYFEKIRKALWVVKGKRVAVLGLAFKANTDDIRFAPALEVMRRLLEEGAEVQATDPEAIARTKTMFPQVAYFEDPYEALKGVDAALVCTEWQIFRKLDWEQAGKVMARRLVIDGRNFHSPNKMQKLGFEYHSFGRP